MSIQFKQNAAGLIRLNTGHRIKNVLQSTGGHSCSEVVRKKMEAKRRNWYLGLSMLIFRLIGKGTLMMAASHFLRLGEAVIVPLILFTMPFVL